MTKIVISTVMALFLFCSTGFQAADTYTLRVEVSNFKDKAASRIQVSVFAADNFLKKSIQTKSVFVATEDKVSVEFDLPPGEYAVSSYQDINSNNKLDRYFFGKPKEPYGFSNNVRSLGPPAYEKCKFTIDTSGKTIAIKLK